MLSPEMKLDFHRPRFPRARHAPGMAMLLVVIALALAITLSISFLSAQSTSSSISQNIRRHDQARYIAESGMAAALQTIQNDSNWRTTFASINPASTVSISGGTHSLTVEDGQYIDGSLSGDGDITNNTTDPVTLTSTGTFENVTHRTRVLVQSAASTLTGLKAEYFIRTSITSLSSADFNDWADYTTTVSQINFGTQPAGTPGWTNGPNTHWAARYSGFVTIPSDANWTFTLTCDDYASLSINNTTVIDASSGASGSKTNSATTYLAAGTYPFDLKHAQKTSGWGLSLSWSNPGLAQTIIPASAFTQSPTVTANTPSLKLNGDFLLLDSSSSKAGHVDAYDSSLGAYGGANRFNTSGIVASNTTASGGVQLTGQTRLNANLQIGVGGDTNTVVQVSNPAVITGTISNLSSPLAFPAITLPSGMPASEGDATLTTNQTFSTNRRFNNLYLRGATAVYTVSGNVAIQCANFQILDSAQLVINSGSTLKIYCTGDAKFHQTSKSNHLSNDPSRLQVYMSGANPTFTLYGNAILHAHVQNPNGHAALTGGTFNQAQFFGVYSGKTMTIGGDQRVHLDMNGISSISSPGGGNSLSFTWQEQP